MSRIVIVRHGNTFPPGTIATRIGSATDLPLTEEGKRQASAVGRWCRHRRWRFVEARCGSLRRARQTAELILREVESAPELGEDTWLNEIDHGVDEGRTDAEIISRVGNGSLSRWDELGIAPPGWHVDAEWRIASWRRFFSTSDDRDILLVTSNGAARYALLAHPELRVGGSMKLATGAWAEINRAADGSMRTIAWNCRPSLETHVN